jgi:predicted nucleic acid-binding protein
MVADASVVVAALLDAGADGDWAQDQLRAGSLAAPHLMPVEAANIIRRAELAGDISAALSTLAHADLLALRMELYPYEPLAWRVWELRHNLTCYDASYVALAEAVNAPLVTLDAAIAGAPGLRCEVRLPHRQRSAALGIRIDVENVAEALEQLDDPPTG